MSAPRQPNSNESFREFEREIQKTKIINIRLLKNRCFFVCVISFYCILNSIIANIYRDIIIKLIYLINIIDSIIENLKRNRSRDLAILILERNIFIKSLLYC